LTVGHLLLLSCRISAAGGSSSGPGVPSITGFAAGHAVQQQQQHALHVQYKQPVVLLVLDMKDVMLVSVEGSSVRLLCMAGSGRALQAAAGDGSLPLLTAAGAASGPPATATAAAAASPAAFAGSDVAASGLVTVAQLTAAKVDPSFADVGAEASAPEQQQRSDTRVDLSSAAAVGGEVEPEVIKGGLLELLVAAEELPPIKGSLADCSLEGYEAGAASNGTAWLEQQRDTTVAGVVLSHAAPGPSPASPATVVAAPHCSVVEQAYADGIGLGSASSNSTADVLQHGIDACAGQQHGQQHQMPVAASAHDDGQSSTAVSVVGDVWSDESGGAAGAGGDKWFVGHILMCSSAGAARELQRLVQRACQRLDSLIARSAWQRQVLL
jgi:hypothetical protein